jgi:hypothetical protein
VTGLVFLDKSLPPAGLSVGIAEGLFGIKQNKRERVCCVRPIHWVNNITAGFII